MNDSATSFPLWLAFMALAEQATRDPLTGLYNRRYFDDTLADHVASANRYERELSLVLFDIDDFKQINDSQGHEAGDEALIQFSILLQSIARKADIICRYGGDEFAVILPETGADAAEQFVARVHGGAADPAPAFTAGIAALPSGNLVAGADADLLAKKRASRQ